MNSSDWQDLCEQCQLGKFKQANPVRGGASDRSWYLQTSSGAFFVKTALGRYLPLLASEAESLQALGKTNTLICPKVIAMYQGVKWSAMVLEWLTLAHNTQPSDHDYALLAETLADLHQHNKAKQFGWQNTNYLELSPQHNVHLSDWVSFLRSQRLLPQITMARDRGLSRNTLEQVDLVMAELDSIFANDLPAPAFVHGNFWYDNIAFSPEGQPIVFKPACYYGDPVMDIARAQLGGHLPERFYSAYWHSAKHRQQETLRLEIYQLYFLLHLFNHLGGEYTKPITQLAQKISDQLSAS